MVGSPICSCLSKGSKEQYPDSRFVQQSLSWCNSIFILSGGLPFNLGKLSKLKFVNLDFNYLEGALPPSLMNCTNLVELHLGFNNLEGDISMLNFSILSQLTKLDLRGNNFTGTLPVSLYSCRSLKAIGLTGNHLEGQIQAEILSLKSLSFLSLGYNQFTNLTGAMKILMSSKSLHILFLTGSFVGEEMPSDDDMVDFDGFQNLWLLSLAYCNLTGRIPSWLGTLPRLFYINLSHNRISDRKTYPPHRLSYFPALIDLSDNNIDGDIPTEIHQLQLLRRLYLNSNNFVGVIPDQISNLKELEVLNLSMNHLSGKITSSLLRLNFLRSLDVSYNNLQGPIPTSTQIQSFNASSFEGNPKLCGDPLPKKCGPNKGIDEDNKNKDVDNGLHQLPWFYIFAALGFIVGFWGVCGSLVINKTWRYAYFRFIDNVQDRLYVMVTMRINTIKRSLRG
ncbi:unnamed protein product [Prunus armeniaca]